FNQIEKSTVENIHILKKELSRMMLTEEKEFVYNVTGIGNLVQKAKEVIELAQVEIYLNTDFQLDPRFSAELIEAVERGVRIIAFSFNRIAVPHPKIELYARSDNEETEYPSHR
ncbi:TrmB family transcriptional regulator sugar-binding domain-containing protein, partial [Vibrio sp. 10N.222.55.E8]